LDLKPELKSARKAKAELDSRTLKDGAIYLFKRTDYKKPTWFCRIKIPNGPGYISCSTKTTDEHAAFAFANELYTQTLVRAANGKEINAKKISLALTEFTEALAEIDKTANKHSTRIQFLTHVKEFFGAKRLDDVTTSLLIDLNAWIRKSSRTGTLSPNTIKRYTTDLKQFFNWCLEKDYIDALPRFPKVKGENNRRPSFNDKDYNKLVRHLREFVKSDYPWVVRDRSMLINYVLILANTGIRVGEARGLKWRDLKEIPQAEGSKEAADIALFVTGKTGPREVVARTPEVKVYFKRLLDLRTEELGQKPSNDDYVFCNRDGSAVGSFKKSFAALIKSAGVEKDSQGDRRTIYSLRHTYATFRLQEGVHQYILAKNMGTSTAMLERHYGHTSNVASAAELTKGGTFKSGKKAKTVDWLGEM
jgi:integrase